MKLLKNAKWEKWPLSILKVILLKNNTVKPVVLYILIRYNSHLFNVVSGHHLFVISRVKPLYNGKFIFKIIPEVISKIRYFSQMYKKSRGVTKYIA